jgi:hypothetical protein
LSLQETDAGKADYRNERKKFRSHDGESREATGLWSTHFPTKKSGILRGATSAVIGDW